MVTLTCEIAEHGNPANYSNPHWQHWIGDILIRNLSSNSLMTTQGFSLILKSVGLHTFDLKLASSFLPIFRIFFQLKNVLFDVFF